MAMDRIIDAGLLRRVGVVVGTPLYLALSGMTISAAVIQLREELAIKLAVEGMNRGAVNSYTVNGRSVTATADLVERTLKILDGLSASANGGGPISMAVRL